MCTVTVLPQALLSSDASDDQLLLRVVCNRDELTTRTPALPPTLWTAGPRRVLMPIDPHSGGTWIAANDAGLVFVLGLPFFWLRERLSGGSTTHVPGARGRPVDINKPW